MPADQGLDQLFTAVGLATTVGKGSAHQSQVPRGDVDRTLAGLEIAADQQGGRTPSWMKAHGPLANPLDGLDPVGGDCRVLPDQLSASRSQGRRGRR